MFSVPGSSHLATCLRGVVFVGKAPLRPSFKLMRICLRAVKLRR